MKNTHYPLLLEGVTVPLIWGGHALSRRYGKGDPNETIGESWELSVRPGRNSGIKNGDYAGQTLDEYLREAGSAAVSDRYVGDRFPLLIKLIDANDRLSVQVHPDDEYAARHEADPGKTEMWYIVDAQPGARLVYGLEPGADAQALGRALEGGDPAALLHSVEVKPGDVFFIPSGMLHSIGAGIIIAEIQQNSDLTYRVYDYGRLGRDGKPRELHVAKALDVVRPFTEAQVDAVRYSAVGGRGDDPELLAACDYFTVCRYAVKSERGLTADSHSFHCLMCVSGSVVLTMAGEDYPLPAGQSCFIPAGSGDFTLSGDGEVLDTRLS